MATISELLRQVNALYDVTTDVHKVDPFNQTVQFEDDSNFVVSPDTSILFSGPPVYGKGGTDAGDIAQFADLLMPIGAIQSIGDNDQNTVQPFPEIGSKLKRTGRGQANYSLNLARVQTFHSNLRFACYQWISKIAAGATSTYRFMPGDNTPGVPDTHFNNFESDLYGVPFGLLYATVTAGGYLVARDYYERCQLLNAGKQVQAGGTLVQEGVQIYVCRKVPARGLSINIDSTGSKFGGDFLIRNPGPNFAPPAASSTLGP